MISGAIKTLKSRGPLIGKDFAASASLEIFPAWKCCSGKKEIITEVVGNRYLRLDARVKGYARLSPSIMREFLNYTVIGLPEQRNLVDVMADRLNKEIKAISKAKIELALQTVTRVIRSHREGNTILEKSCLIIAGDVVFGMAHAEPRPESSTGELVKGSDLDIIVVTDKLPGYLKRDLDRFFYDEKYNLLMNPALKEELDYIIKDISVISSQLRFDTFKNMVASKILDEGQYLYGNQALYNQIKTMVDEAAVPSKIADLTKRAEADRLLAEQTLAGANRLTTVNEQLMALFYTTEEKEEIF